MALEEKVGEASSDIKKYPPMPNYTQQPKYHKKPAKDDYIKLTDWQLIKGGLIAGALSIIPGAILYYQIVPHIIKHGLQWPF